MSGAFGFGDNGGGKPPGESTPKPSLADAVSAIRPRAVEGSVDVASSDAVAKSHGFASREEVGPVSRRRVAAEPSQPFSMRLPRSVLARFARFADAEGLSYPKALAKLLEKSEA
ncbi:MAG: hypothetical protein LCH93_16810 [Proteobacteria bacterium]|nr:hypothetical protein [Pseudomonadota bacterium]